MGFADHSLDDLFDLNLAKLVVLQIVGCVDFTEQLFDGSNIYAEGSRVHPRPLLKHHLRHGSATPIGLILLPRGNFALIAFAFAWMFL
jgi:hypothetical protein